MWQSKGPLIAMPASYKYPPSSREHEKQQRPSVYTADEHVIQNCPFLFSPYFSHLFSYSCTSFSYHFVVPSATVCPWQFSFFSLFAPLSPLTCLPPPWFTKPESLYLVWPPTLTLTCHSHPLIQLEYMHTHRERERLACATCAFARSFYDSLAPSSVVLPSAELPSFSFLDPGTQNSVLPSICREKQKHGRRTFLTVNSKACRLKEVLFLLPTKSLCYNRR